MTKQVRIDIFDPVHFHGALPLQRRYKDITGLDISPDVHVYYSDRNELSAFNGMAGKIEASEKGWKIWYNPSEMPLEAMLNAKTGNVLVLACPNVGKIGVIGNATESGIYNLILSDKPWVIQPEGMDTLRSAISTASENGTILQDIMTERYELGNIIQRSIMLDEKLFGELEQGSEAKPAISKSSIHLLDKSHMGVVRPPEYFDTRWQGDGMVDVTTHLVDMVNWSMRPNSEVNPDDVSLLNAKRWATTIPPDSYKAMTKGAEIEKPLEYFCNGSFGYVLDGTHVGIRVVWNLKGEDDEHYSKIEGTKITVEVEKGPNDEHQKVYITPKAPEAEVMTALQTHLGRLAGMGYEGISITKEGKRFRLNIPDKLYIGHFQHFGEFTTQALRYLAGQDTFNRALEDSRLITKYHTTTTALKMAGGGR